MWGCELIAAVARFQRSKVIRSNNVAYGAAVVDPSTFAPPAPLRAFYPSTRFWHVTRRSDPGTVDLILEQWSRFHALTAVRPLFGEEITTRFLARTPVDQKMCAQYSKSISAIQSPDLI
jgi:hypothetical protein